MLLFTDGLFNLCAVYSQETINIYTHVEAGNVERNDSLDKFKYFRHGKSVLMHAFFN